MRKITRYVLFELVTVFAITLAAVTLLLIFAVLVKEGIREGLGFTAIVKMLPYVVPVALQPSLPATILIAACVVYGRMAADNEIVAIKSLGISPFAVIAPGLALGFLVSIVAVWMNDLAPSWGRMGIYRVAIDSAEETVYRLLRTQRYIATDFFSMNVKAVKGKRLIEPHITVHGSGGSSEIYLHAREAILENDPENNVIIIELRGGIADIGNDTTIDFRNETYRQPIPLPNISRKGNNRDSPSLIPLRDIDSETITQRKLTADAEQLAATQAAYQLMVGDFAGMGTPDWTHRMHMIEGHRTRLHRLNFEPYRRWAFGFSCFFFVLVGAPLAIQMKTRNFFTTFAACFFPILLAYYPLLAFAVDRAKDGAVPPITVWLGNLVMTVCGAVILRRVLRY